jgi:hypothetical protein
MGRITTCERASIFNGTAVRTQKVTDFSSVDKEGKRESGLHVESEESYDQPQDREELGGNKNLI